MFKLQILFLSAVWPLLSAKSLWATFPASSSDMIREAYPVGNGKLGAMPFGNPGLEKININIDSLWSGGPFTSDLYTGGNPGGEVYSSLPGIRETIFREGTGDVSALLGNSNYYGSFTVLGNLSLVISGITSWTEYNRSLDLSLGLHTTTYTANDGNIYSSITYCSYPDQVCVYNLSSTKALPEVIVYLENLLLDPSLVNSTCSDNHVELSGVTQQGPPTGMRFEAMVISSALSSHAHCSNDKPGVLVIPESSDIYTLSFIIGAGTNYDQTKGNPANKFSFQGADPGPYVKATTSASAAMNEVDIRLSHIKDYGNLTNAFTLDLPDIAGSAGIETSVIINRYNYTTAGDPYLESLLFAYARHLFISSSRQNSLPPNLQGRWSSELDPEWSADYHADINLQMNLWAADQTGLGSLQDSVWNYIQDTWVPRGTETAQLLYGAASGWVTHDEMNIFGHTGMKNEASWADYPASAAWMMQHVWDHYEYVQDAEWLKSQGYPLIKGVANFWLSQLQLDGYFNDGTFVVNPCNSPEHGPTTFACTHYQQLLYQVFEAILSAASIVGDEDKVFLSNITETLVSLDKGLHIGTWGEVKEWKIPDSFGYDFENDTHRHLSNLVGWYPGYSISSFLGGYTNATIQNAVKTSLYSRGMGNATDADAGWEKVWRSACWARLNNTDMAYLELKFAIGENFAGNGLSMYSGVDLPFQIDANFGLAGAILSMLVVDLPMLSSNTGVQTVVLGPAIPALWGGGQVHGLRLRGGGYVDFHWDDRGLVDRVNLVGRTNPLLIVDKNSKVLVKYH